MSETTPEPTVKFEPVFTAEAEVIPGNPPETAECDDEQGE